MLKSIRANAVAKRLAKERSGFVSPSSAAGCAKLMIYRARFLDLSGNPNMREVPQSHLQEFVL